MYKLDLYGKQRPYPVLPVTTIVDSQAFLPLDFASWFALVSYNKGLPGSHISSSTRGYSSCAGAGVLVCGRRASGGRRLAFWETEAGVR